MTGGSESATARSSSGRVAHLTGRFFGSLTDRRPSADDERWARELLAADEVKLWDRMAPVDQAHSVNVARRVEHGWDRLDDPSLPSASAQKDVVLRAALLHDVGKTEARLGTYGRVIATISGAMAGRDMALAWSDGRGFTRRVGLYLRYPELGAVSLELAGSDPLVVAWAREHHLPPEDWTVPSQIGELLAEADG